MVTAGPPDVGPFSERELSDIRRLVKEELARWNMRDTVVRGEGHREGAEAERNSRAAQMHAHELARVVAKEARHGSGALAFVDEGVNNLTRETYKAALRRMADAAGVTTGDAPPNGPLSRAERRKLEELRRRQGAAPDTLLAPLRHELLRKLDAGFREATVEVATFDSHLRVTGNRAALAALAAALDLAASPA